MYNAFLAQEAVHAKLTDMASSTVVQAIASLHATALLSIAANPMRSARNFFVVLHS